MFLETGLLLEVCNCPAAASLSVVEISSPWSVSRTCNPSPLPHLDPPSKQNLPSTTPYRLRFEISQCPARRGGTPVLRQKPRSWTCSLAGPGWILAFVGAEDSSTRNCGPSPRCVLSLTCHCISLSLLSKAKTTTTSWQRIATVFDSLSSVKPVSNPRNCCSESEAFVWPCLYRSLESLYSCRYKQSETKEKLR